MDTSETRVPLQGVAKIFEAGLKSKTWDIHGMLQFITTTHRKGCDMCEAYTLHGHNNLTDNVRMAENKASTQQDRHQKADEKLAQANSKITELEAKLTELQQELTVLQMQDKRMPIVWGNLYDFSGSDSEPTLADQARKGRRARHSHQPSAMGASSQVKPVCWYWLMSRY